MTLVVGEVGVTLVVATYELMGRKMEVMRFLTFLMTLLTTR